jgi:hypothetical protein
VLIEIEIVTGLSLLGALIVLGRALIDLGSRLVRLAREFIALRREHLRLGLEKDLYERLIQVLDERRLAEAEELPVQILALLAPVEKAVPPEPT